MFKESASIGHILPMPIPPKIADTCRCRYRLIGTSLILTNKKYPNHESNHGYYRYVWNTEYISTSTLEVPTAKV